MSRERTTTAFVIGDEAPFSRLPPPVISRSFLIDRRLTSNKVVIERKRWRRADTGLQEV